MFTLMQSDVIRTQVFVPQDEAFGLEPGVDAVVRVPEIPGRTFPGKVTRIANALQPGTRTLLTEIDVPNPDGALSPGNLLHRRTADPAQDRLSDIRRTPSSSTDGLHVAVVENGIAHSEDHGRARPRQRGRGRHGVKPAIRSSSIHRSTSRTAARSEPARRRKPASVHA